MMEKNEIMEPKKNVKQREKSDHRKKRKEQNWKKEDWERIVEKGNRKENVYWEKNKMNMVNKEE